MMEDDRQQQHLLPCAKRVAIDSEQQYLRRSKGGGQGELAEMKSQSGGRVEGEIDVMDGVEAPQLRHVMVQPMPEVQRVVEQQESERHANDARKRQPPQETDAAA